MLLDGVARGVCGIAGCWIVKLYAQAMRICRTKYKVMYFVSAAILFGLLTTFVLLPFVPASSPRMTLQSVFGLLIYVGAFRWFRGDGEELAAPRPWESGAIRMSARQARAVGRNPNLEQTYRGQVIDSAVKNGVRGDSDLSHLWVSRSGEFGPDFHDIGTNTWWDVTTPGQWSNHVNSYTDPFGSGIGLFTR